MAFGDPDSLEEAIIGGAVVLLVAGLALFWAIKETHSKLNVRVILPATAPIPDVKKTISSIFEVLKEHPVSEDQFAGMMDTVGISGFAVPPDGWQYMKSSAGIFLKKIRK